MKEYVLNRRLMQINADEILSALICVHPQISAVEKVTLINL